MVKGRSALRRQYEELLSDLEDTRGKLAKIPSRLDPRAAELSSQIADVRVDVCWNYFVVGCVCVCVCVCVQLSCSRLCDCLPDIPDAPVSYRTRCNNVRPH